MLHTKMKFMMQACLRQNIYDLKSSVIEKLCSVYPVINFPSKSVSNSRLLNGSQFCGIFIAQSKFQTILYYLVEASPRPIHLKKHIEF